MFNHLTADVVVRQIERAHSLIIGQLCKGQSQEAKAAEGPAISVP